MAMWHPSLARPLVHFSLQAHRDRCLVGAHVGTVAPKHTCLLPCLCRCWRQGTPHSQNSLWLQACEQENSLWFKEADHCLIYVCKYIYIYTCIYIRYIYIHISLGPPLATPRVRFFPETELTKISSVLKIMRRGWPRLS